MTFNILTSIGYTEKSPAGPEMLFCGSYNKAVFINLMYMHHVIINIIIFTQTTDFYTT